MSVFPTSTYTHGRETTVTLSNGIVIVVDESQSSPTIEVTHDVEEALMTVLGATHGSIKIRFVGIRSNG